MRDVFFIKLENRFTGSSEMGNGKETRQEVLVTILRVWVAEYEYANVVQNRAVLLSGQSRVKISKGTGYWGDSDDVNLKSCIDSQCQLGNHENEVSISWLKDIYINNQLKLFTETEVNYVVLNANSDIDSKMYSIQIENKRKTWYSGSKVVLGRK